MKKTITILHSEHGFALIVAIMMLFAATIMSLMVMNSSETEILLSGAQQRYENNFNVVEGALNLEARKVGGKSVSPSGGSNFNFNYQIPVPPPDKPKLLSPFKSHAPNFDPGNDMTVDDEATEYTVGYDDDFATDVLNNPPEKWPMSNLLQTVAAVDNSLDYHYRVVFLRGSVEKGTGTDVITYNRVRVSTYRSSTIEMEGSILGTPQQAEIE